MLVPQIELSLANELYLKQKRKEKKNRNMIRCYQMILNE